LEGAREAGGTKTCTGAIAKQKTAVPQGAASQLGPKITNGTRSSQRQRDQVINFVVSGLVLRYSVLGVRLLLSHLLCVPRNAHVLSGYLERVTRRELRIGENLWQSYRDAVDQTVDKPIVINHGEIDRRAWECALLLKLRDELKAGNLSVRYSKRFARLEQFLIDDLRWHGMREDFFRRSGLPSDTKRVPEYLTRRLAEAYERFLKTAPSNSYAVVDKDGWRLSTDPTEKLDQEEQDRLARLKS